MIPPEDLQIKNEVELVHIIATVAVIVLSSVLVFFLFFANNNNNGKSSSKMAAKHKFLNRERQKAALKELIQLSHDTKLFRFALPDDTCLGLPCGKHIKVFAPNPNSGGKLSWNGNPDAETDDEVERKYTPTSSDEDVGKFELVVKVYKPNERFGSGGKVSQYLDTLKVGDELEFSGPWGIIEYLGHGVFKKGSKEIRAKEVGMIAGGTGITPMLQVLDAILRDDSDSTKVSLVFGNQTEPDILLYSELNERAKRHPDKFKVHYTLDRPPEGWKQSTGFVTKDMIESNLPAASDETVVLLCGPPPMIKFACKPNLEALNYAMDKVLEF